MNGPETTTHRKVLIVWHVLILVILVWLITRPRDGDLNWIWISVIATPVLVLAATWIPLKFQTRSLIYWLLAAATIPTALGGILSLIGPIFIVSVILLIWAARRENPSPEMVQM